MTKTVVLHDVAVVVMIALNVRKGILNSVSPSSEVESHKSMS